MIGASRTGKGTLLCALQGREMRFFERKKDNVKDTAAAKEAEKAKRRWFMAPVGEDELPENAWNHPRDRVCKTCVLPDQKECKRCKETEEGKRI